jgi:hypothetical protein
MSDQQTQWIRKLSLQVFNTKQARDLSDFRVRFDVQNADTESPNTAVIRVYNLSPDTIKNIRDEFGQVQLSAGYQQGNFGLLFQGSIKQFRVGRESATDTFLDIFAADGDIGYNNGVVNTSLVKGQTPQQVANKLSGAMVAGSDFGSLTTSAQYVPSIRGQVLFGMARARMRNLASHLDASWSFDNGQIVLIDNTGYRDGQVVDLNVSTGLVGMPEQTDGGITCVSLLNSRYRIGCQVHLNNKDINQLIQNTPTSTPYNRWAGVQQIAPIDADGLYRAFAVNHNGDSRGNEWYSHLTLLSITPNPSDRLNSVPATVTNGP